MNEQLRNWHPTPAEVADIVQEMRPLIRELARRDSQAISGCSRPSATRRRSRLTFAAA